MRMPVMLKGLTSEELDEMAQVLKQPDGVQERLVWTIGYNPWVMGGNVNAPVGARIPALGPFLIGRGLKAYLVLSPSGIIHVAEGDTGAFIGMTLQEVREDVRTGDPEVMKHQIDKAWKDSKRVKVLEPREFWSWFRAEKNWHGNARIDSGIREVKSEEERVRRPSGQGLPEPVRGEGTASADGLGDHAGDSLRQA